MDYYIDDYDFEEIDEAYEELFNDFAVIDFDDPDDFEDDSD